MSADDLATVVRYVNITLSAISVLLLLRKAVLYWPHYQSRTKDFWWVLMSWSLAILLGTIEVLAGWNTQFRTLFILFALLLTIKVMLKPNEVTKPTFTNQL